MNTETHKTHKIQRNATPGPSNQGASQTIESIPLPQSISGMANQPNANACALPNEPNHSVFVNSNSNTVTSPLSSIPSLPNIANPYCQFTSSHLPLSAPVDAHIRRDTPPHLHQNHLPTYAASRLGGPPPQLPQGVAPMAPRLLPLQLPREHPLPVPDRQPVDPVISAPQHMAPHHIPPPPQYCILPLTHYMRLPQILRLLRTLRLRRIFPHMRTPTLHSLIFLIPLFLLLLQLLV